MSLTSRQRAFLDKLLTLYHDAQEPVHYTTVAQHLGVGNTTAYEMMRLLEEKGYVRSEYVLAQGSGPGRSSVVFSPTFKALRTFRRLAGTMATDEGWETVKERILSTIGQGDTEERELLDDLVVRIGLSDSPLVYCAETITALLLNVRQELRSRLGEHELVKRIMAPDAPKQPPLDLLPGFALGLSPLMERASRQIDKLVEYAQEYQERLQRLDSQKRETLRSFLREVMTSLQAGETSEAQ